MWVWILFSLHNKKLHSKTACCAYLCYHRLIFKFVWWSETLKCGKHAKKLKIRKGANTFSHHCIALRRALRSENNHGCHIEGSFQTKVLKTGHFKGPFGMKDFEGYNWWTFRPPHDPLCWFFPWWQRLRIMMQKGTSRNSCLVPYTLQPFKALTLEGKPFEGIRA